jgi:hypothetical protein
VSSTRFDSRPAGASVNTFWRRGRQDWARDFVYSTAIGPLHGRRCEGRGVENGIDLAPFHNSRSRAEEVDRSILWRVSFSRAPAGSDGLGLSGCTSRPFLCAHGVPSRRYNPRPAALRRADCESECAARPTASGSGQTQTLDYPLAAFRSGSIFSGECSLWARLIFS